ncbi:sensor histidine kinase [Microaceticoccus formicicus]|uniref:sensor histidine kinase n=1 Tax=Microaceticoccus formicicus TaxID=3118105 RepID=UPI003CD02584|nr:sensor histidine kinase [Peptoniphilaceae bacterium AMB_02]
MKEFILSQRHLLLFSIFNTTLFGVISYLYNIDVKGPLVYSAFLYYTALMLFLIYRYIVYDAKKKLLMIHLSNGTGVDENEFSYRKDGIERLQSSLYKAEVKRNTEILAESLEKKTERDYYLNLWTHQVKTPLTAMNLIVHGNLKNSEKDLKRELKKTENYIDNIINYMKIEEDSVDFVFREHSLKEIVNGAIVNNSILFIYKNLSAQVDIKDIEVLTDKKWLVFALEQILTNSVKYTETGGVRIYNESNNPYILHVIDTGRGIPAEELPKITDMGYTGTIGRNDPNATGIGLYITDRILGKLGYAYKIKSEVGVGTEFIINLKREKLVTDH